MSATTVETPPKAAAESPAKRFAYYRHSALVRATHWVNLLCIVLLLMSGMAIFNAHPALYWGAQSDFTHPLLNLGLSEPDAIARSRPFPDWLTGGLELPNGRRWHLFVIWAFILNGLLYVVASLLDDHVWHDLLPTRWQLGEIWTTIRHHLRLFFPRQRDYNVLQKFVYLGVIFVLLPAVILTGLSLSPGMDAITPWLGNLFGGRQSARTIHFICAALIVIFIFVHLALVLLSGFWNNMRSMITGEYEVDAEEPVDGGP